MSYPITRTKIIPPRRNLYLLSRQRVLAMLEDLLEYRLTLISAPAGYGKTSLLVDLTDKEEYPVCWLALDPLDADPLRFLNYLVAAVQEQFPGFGKASQSLLDNQTGPDLDLDQILNPIINDLYDHVEEHFALVLDDFHLIDNEPLIIQIINRFAQEMDENCHLVILSRSLISLPDLPLMIGRSQVSGLNFEELAFLPEEIKDLYLLRFQQSISDQEAVKITDQFEGWITGLLLSAEAADRGRSDQGRAARAAGVDLHDYLARQVLDKQPEELKAFMLQTAIMEEFNADLCSEVLDGSIGEKDCEGLIQELLQRNLFVHPVGSDGSWLRYHHLLQEFLARHFFDEWPEKAESILRRLIDVYISRDWHEKAYAACLRLGDDNLTEEYLVSASPSLVHSGQISLLRTWLDNLPQDQIDNNSQLLIHRAGIAAHIGEPEAGLVMLKRAKYLGASTLEQDLSALLLVRKAACHRVLGECDLGLEEAQKAELLATKSPSAMAIQAEAQREIGLNLQRLGQNQEAKSYLERSLANYYKIVDRDNAANVEIGLGNLEMSEGDYPAARAYFLGTYKLWKELGNLTRLVGVCNNLAVLDHLLGAYRQAHEWMELALNYARKTNNLRATGFALASKADLVMELGALLWAEQYLIKSRKIADQIGDIYLRIYTQLAQITLARRSGNIPDAVSLLNQTRMELRSLPEGYESAQFFYEEALLHIAEDQLNEAYTAFEESFELFSRLRFPRESCLSLLQMANLDCHWGNMSAARKKLDRVHEIVVELGTAQPIVPALSSHDDLIHNLVNHFPDDTHLEELTEDVTIFRSDIPGLLKDLDLERKPADPTKVLDFEINGFGQTRVIQKGKQISKPEWRKQKTVREIFFYLLSNPEGVSRDEICLNFWPDSQPEQLKKQFKNALYRLRRAIGPDAILYDKLTRLYTFNWGLDYRYDVEEFQTALDEVNEDADLEVRIRALEKAVDLYSHPFAPALDGIWIEPIRYGLFLNYEGAALDLAGLHIDHQNPTSALEILEDLLITAPGLEAAWRLAMQAHAARGDRSGVEDTYLRCQELLENELDVQPSVETQALYKRLTS